jgi:hypothetical protein
MSEADDKALLGLRARRLDVVLDELGDLSRRSRAGEPVRVPLVTLYVDSGAVFTGFILDLEPEPRGGKWLLVHIPGEGSRQPAPDVVYLHGDHIVALIVHNVVEMGKPPADAPSPTRLELRREMEQVNNEINSLLETEVCFQIEWEELPDEGDPLWALDYLLRTAGTVIKDVAADDLGRQALAGKLQVIRLAVGEKAEALLVDGTLHLTSGAAVASRLSAAELLRALEAGL